MLHIGLIGDYNSSVTAHRAIPIALRMAANALSKPIEDHWIPTEEIQENSFLAQYDGLWCVPASPYRSMEGALLAIRYARESNIPFLGTCGGFQHAIVEYARNVLGWKDAEHAETAPDAAFPVITPLECSLVEKTGVVRLQAGSRLARAYGREEITEGYHCRYGLNPTLQAKILTGTLRIGAVDSAGEVRAVELDSHPFFVATLFQPERAALNGIISPPVLEFVRTIATRQNPI